MSRLGLPERFQEVELLGKGGMGAVYRARDQVLDRVVAVKTLLPGVSRESRFLARFQREARVQARLEHPNLVRIYDAEVHSEPPFLVMEYVAGRDLAQQVRVGRTLDGPALQRLARELAGALDALHEAGILHRDLKPANVMLRDRDGAAVLMDLGIASLQDATVLTRTGSLLGTPLYFPPEILRGEGWTPASDQYQMAAVLFEAATAHRLVPPGNPQAMLVRIQRGGLPDWPVVPEWPSGIRGAIERGLELDPARRYPNCADLAEALGSGSTPSRRVPGSPASSGHSSAPSGLHPAFDEEAGGSWSLRRLLVWGVFFNLLLLGILLAWPAAAPSEISYQVVGDALVVDFRGGEGRSPRLQVGKMSVEEGTPGNGGRTRLVFRGLPREESVRARLIWEGGEDSGAEFSAREAALPKLPQLVAGAAGSPALRVEVRREIRLDAPVPAPIRLEPGLHTLAWSPPGNWKLPWRLSWDEEGLPFAGSWAPREVAEASLEQWLQELEGIRPGEDLARLASRGESGPFAFRESLETALGLAPWVPALLGSPLPRSLRYRLLETWQVWDLASSQLRALGDPAPGARLEEGLPGSRPGSPPRGEPTAPIEVTLVDRAPHHDHIRITNSIGRHFGGIFARYGSAARLTWPHHTTTRETRVTVSIEVSGFHPDSALVLTGEAPGGESRRLWLWRNPLEILQDGKSAGWLRLTLPGDLTPEPGSEVELRLEHLFQPRGVLARIERMRLDVGARPDSP